MTFHDVIRHLVHHGPFATDTERDEALAAIDEHEAATTSAPAGEVTGTGSLSLPAPAATSPEAASADAEPGGL